MTISQTKAAEVAAFLADEHAGRRVFYPYAREKGIDTLDDAYAVQTAYLDRIAPDYRQSRSGYKVGLTSARIQEMCGLDHPVTGVILSGRVLASGATLSLAEFGRIGLEFEIAVTLAHDLPPRDLPYTAADISAAVGTVAAAFEVVDDRNCDYATLDVLSLVADNSWNARVILGAAVPARGIDLAAAPATVWCNGAQIDAGRGSDALGGPLLVVEWLANHARERGLSLRAGDVIMTGSLVATIFPEAGSTYAFHVSGIGSVEVGIVP